jgi:tetratricopeptide (TPR) repeat protein
MGASARSKGTLDGALERSIEAALTRVRPVSEERAAASARLSELLSLPSREMGRMINSHPSFQTYPLAVLVLEQAEQAIRQNPATVVKMARLARTITAKVASRTCGGKAALADLGAYALAVEGNAMRVSGNLPRALELFQTARQVQRLGAVDPDLMARMDRLESSLRRNLRQFNTALTLLDRAEEKFRAIKDDDQIASTIINRANLFFVQGDFDGAKDILESAHNLTHDPFLVLSIKHNTIDILARSGQPREAADLLEQTRSLYLAHSSPLLSSQRLWVESVIARELDRDLDVASELMMEATCLLVDHGYDSTFAEIELEVLRARKTARQAAGASEHSCGPRLS